MEFSVTKQQQERSSSHLCLFYLLPGLKVPLRVSQQFYTGYYLLPPAELWNLLQHSRGPCVFSCKCIIFQTRSSPKKFFPSHISHISLCWKTEEVGMLHSGWTTSMTNSLKFLVTALPFPYNSRTWFCGFVRLDIFHIYWGKYFISLLLIRQRSIFQATWTYPLEYSPFQNSIVSFKTRHQLDHTEALSKLQTHKSDESATVLHNWKKQLYLHLRKKYWITKDPVTWSL